MKPRSRLVFIPALLLAAGAARAQPGGPARGTATRQVSQYLDRERALAAALDDGDRTAAAAMLADGFNARLASQPDLLDREGWLAQETPGRSRDRFVRELAVQEIGDVAIVSFLLDQTRRQAVETLFVVDVWKSGQLMSRQAARATGVPAPSRRPTGRG